MPVPDSNGMINGSIASGGAVNIGNAAYYRNKKRIQGLSDPMSAVSQMPEWDALWGGIEKKKDEAADNGMGFSMSVQQKPGGGTMDPWAAPMNPNQLRSRQASVDAADFGQRYQAGQASLDALQAEARMKQDSAYRQVMAGDPTLEMENTREALDRQGVINDFSRGEQVKDAGNTAGVYQAGAPTRRAQEYDALQTAREMYPYGAIQGGLEKAKIEAGAKVREAETNRARENSAALRAFADVAKARAIQPPTIAGPKGDEIPNPAYDDLGEALGTFQRVIGGDEQPTGKQMSHNDLLDFAQQNHMDEQSALDLARQHGWTVR